eukprot:550140-Prorocentrum_minimum.AAC.1
MCHERDFPAALLPCARYKCMCTTIAANMCVCVWVYVISMYNDHLSKTSVTFPQPLQVTNAGVTEVCNTPATLPTQGRQRCNAPAIPSPVRV